MPTEQIDLAGSLAIIDHIQTVIEFCLLSTWKKPTPCCLFCDNKHQITLLISLLILQSTSLDVKLCKLHGWEAERDGRLRTTLGCDHQVARCGQINERSSRPLPRKSTVLWFQPSIFFSFHIIKATIFRAIISDYRTGTYQQYLFFNGPDTPLWQLCQTPAEAWAQFF